MRLYVFYLVHMSTCWHVCPSKSSFILEQNAAVRGMAILPECESVLVCRSTHQPKRIPLGSHFADCLEKVPVFPLKLLEAFAVFASVQKNCCIVTLLGRKTFGPVTAAKTDAQGFTSINVSDHDGKVLFDVSIGIMRGRLRKLIAKLPDTVDKFVQQCFNGVDRVRLRGPSVRFEWNIRP